MRTVTIPEITLLQLEDDDVGWVFLDGALRADIDEDTFVGFRNTLDRLNVSYETIEFPYDIVYDMLDHYMNRHTPADAHLRLLPVVRNYVAYVMSFANADPGEYEEPLEPAVWFAMGQPTVYVRALYEDDEDEDEDEDELVIEWEGVDETPEAPVADIPAHTEWPNESTFKDWGTAPD